MAEDIQTLGKQVSFSQLFSDFQRVEIPIIQRDYAQGRPGQEELRHDFLLALKVALEKPVDDVSLPLDLDFVYGSAFALSQSSTETVFSPLDGQQRLTTLFLLHWYLAWRDKKGDDFQQRFMVNRRSRFSYEVRQSSHDFFNGLGLNVPSEEAVNVTWLGPLIEDKPWFFQSWRNDPTIVSALTIVEEIHDLFQDCAGYYERLTDPSKRRITFQLLELKHFGLSDDLYIKMNARGKPLTPFENFKARLEQHLDELLPNEKRSFADGQVPIAEYFSQRMDTAWTDLFWEQREPDEYVIDTRVMRLVKAVSLVCLDPENERATNAVSDLRSLGANISFGKLLDLNCLNTRMLHTLVAVLDYWSASLAEEKDNQSSFGYGSRRAFDRATAGDLSYPELVKFAGFCAFIRSHTLPVSQQARDSWLRVIANLVTNSDIERPADFLDALKSINQLTSHSDRILEYLAEGGDVTAFSRQQVREERVKAALLLRTEEWHTPIVAAERHGYFAGQIEFLLRFAGILDHWTKNSAIAWTDEEDATARALFSSYLKKAEAVFDTNGLRPFGSNKWERALLSVGDYTLAFGKNRSFLQDTTGSGERRPTWKLLLRGHLSDAESEQKRQFVKGVLDKLDLEKGVDASLGEIIQSSQVAERWRQMIVQTPQMIAYCTQNMFRPRDGGAVYLISKQRTSSEHAELWSYHLYLTTLKKMAVDDALSPLSLSYRFAFTDDYPPACVLTWRDSKIEIDFTGGKFRLALRINPAESHQYLISELQRSFPMSADQTWNYLWVTTDKIRDPIKAIAAAAWSFEEKATQPKT